MGDKFLTKEIADALCTVITLGFMKSNRDATPKNKQTDFQYSDPKQADDYKKLFTTIDNEYIKLSSPTSPALAQPKYKMPCILTKTNEVFGEDQLKGIVENFWGYINTLSIEKEIAPSGAYIGGWSNSASTITIAGPSALSTCGAEYRDVGPEIATSYKTAVEYAQKIIRILNDHKPKSGSNTTYSDKCCEEPQGPIAKDQLFHSHHGMIRAMMQNPMSIGKDVYFEIALGEETDKVSSCVPCSIFMSANGMPATSTHLGRGDNWAIPTADNSLASPLIVEWETAVRAHYETGLGLVTPKIDSLPKIKAMRDTLSSK
jgi:hypothetical protein